MVTMRWSVTAAATYALPFGLFHKTKAVNLTHRYISHGHSFFEMGA